MFSKIIAALEARLNRWAGIDELDEPYHFTADEKQALAEVYVSPRGMVSLAEVAKKVFHTRKGDSAQYFGWLIDLHPEILDGLIYKLSRESHGYLLHRSNLPLFVGRAKAVAAADEQIFRAALEKSSKATSYHYA